MSIARIYGKPPGVNRFRPLDLKNGCFVVNLMHASTFWTDDEVEHARTRLMPQLIDGNPGHKFQLRVVNKS